MQTQITPVLQAQDGTFFGTDSNGNMDRFDQTGNIQWSVSDSPQVATADNGVIGASSTTYDANGNATGQTTSPSDSWTGNTYQLGSIEETFSVPPDRTAPPYWSSALANQSLNNASPICHDRRDELVAQYGNRVVGDAYFRTRPYPRFTPNCFMFTSSAHSFYFTFAEINVPNPNVQPNVPGWALIRNPLVVTASSGYGLDAWRQIFNAPRIINSGYRDPNQDTNNNSRHMFGDAIDLQNQTCPAKKSPCGPAGMNEWQQMVDAAGSSANGVPSSANGAGRNTGAQADYVEPQSLPKGQVGCGFSCTHADWRFHDRGIYAH